MRKALSVLLGLALMTVAGCGGASGIVPVSGKVTLNGKALPNAHVSFLPKGRAEDGTAGVSSYAHTDKDGRYELRTLDDDAGALVGVHQVRITIPAEENAASAASRTKPFKHSIPARYRNGSLEFTVKAGGHTDADFAIKTE